MNAPQKAALLIGTLALLFLLLFMRGMDHDGIGAVAAGGVIAVAAGIYLLRNTDS